MTDGNPPRKKRWGILKRRHSDHHLSDERGRTETDENERSSLPPSQSRSGRGPFRLVRKLWAKVTKSPSTRPAGRSLNPAPMTSSSNTQHPISSQSSQGPSPNTVLVSEAILGQDANSSGAKVETPDQRLVKGKIADATQSLAGISQVPEIAQNIGSATNNLQSAPDSDVWKA